MSEYEEATDRVVRAGGHPFPGERNDPLFASTSIQPRIESNPNPERLDRWKLPELSDRDIHTSDQVMDKFISDVWDTVDAMGNLLISKQKDYGPGNINNAFGGPMNGLLVRMGDKFERIKNLIASGKDPMHESIQDSFIDLANYSIIAMMVTSGNWPKNKEDRD